MKEVDRDTGNCVSHYRDRIAELVEKLDSLLSEGQREEWQKIVDQFVAKGLPDELAQKMAGVRFLFSMLSIVQAADQTGLPLEQVARAFFAMGEFLELHWFYQELGRMEVGNHWQSLARDGVRDELAMQQRALTVSLLKMESAPEDISERMSFWCEQNAVQVSRWKAILEELRSATGGELAMYTVATRELMDLAQGS